MAADFTAMTKTVSMSLTLTAPSYDSFINLAVLLEFSFN